MKVFCDTNIFVAAFLANHPHHHAARPVIERVKARIDEGYMAAHSLAEAYAVITRLPGGNRIAPGFAWQLVNENAVKIFSAISLTPDEYARVIEDAATKAIEGGKIHDTLLLAAAAKCEAERIYTFNVGHFQSLADAPLRQRIVAP